MGPRVPLIQISSPRNHSYIFKSHLPCRSGHQENKSLSSLPSQGCASASPLSPPWDSASHSPFSHFNPNLLYPALSGYIQDFLILNREPQFLVQKPRGQMCYGIPNISDLKKQTDLSPRLHSSQWAWGQPPVGKLIHISAGRCIKTHAKLGKRRICITLGQARSGFAAK